MNALSIPQAERSNQRPWLGLPSVHPTPGVFDPSMPLERTIEELEKCHSAMLKGWRPKVWNRSTRYTYGEDLARCLWQLGWAE